MLAKLLLAIYLALLATIFSSPGHAHLILGRLASGPDVSKTTFAQPGSTLSAVLAPRAPYSYSLDKFLKFYGFDNLPPNEKRNRINMLKRATSNVIDMVTVAHRKLTSQVLPGNTPTDPTFLRYLWASSEAASTVRLVLQGINEGIGNVELDKLREACHAIPSPPEVHFYYLNPPPQIVVPTGSRCGSGLPLYTAFSTTNPPIHDVIVICEEFFTNFQDYIKLDSTKQIIGPSIQTGLQRQDREPAWISAQALLHEFLHYRLLYKDKVTVMPLDLNIAGNIADLSIQDNTGRRTVAYGSWAAQRILDQTFSVWFNGISSDRLRNPLYNVDNYSFMIMEYWIKERYMPGINWQDSPDNR